MDEFREVTLEERQAMMLTGVFDINGNIPPHPGYTGIHQLEDGSYTFWGEPITDDETIHAIEHRDDAVASVTPPKKHWLMRLLRR